MKNIFSGFYTSSDEELKDVWNSETVLFVFDTNVLLNLYSYTKDTRKDFFKILEKLSEKIWIPYHVGLEYQRGRLNTVKNEKAVFRNIYKKIDHIKSVFHKDLEEMNLKRRNPSLFDKTKELESKILKLLDDYNTDVKEFDDKQPCVRSSDKIRKKIDELFENRVGSKPNNQEELEAIFKDGEQRFNNKVPPGYMDESEKKKRPSFSFENLTYIPMYGDLIIWKQIIEKARDEKIKSIIFISDDVKEDWIFYIDSNGRKDIGVRAELRQELQKESNIDKFEIYDTSKFMELGKENLSIKITDTSIFEAKENTEEKRKISLEDLGNTNIHINETIEDESFKKIFNFLERVNILRRKELKERRNSLMKKIDSVNYDLGMSIEKGHTEDELYYLKELSKLKKDLRRINREIRALNEGS